MQKEFVNSSVSLASGVAAVLRRLRLLGETTHRVIFGALALSAFASAQPLLSEVEARERGQPAGCPSAWCGCYLAHQLGMAHRKDLWSARAWVRVGRPTRPRIGAVVVWRHHVGVIVGKKREGWVIKSGNDGNRVRIRVRSIRAAIAFRAL